MLIKQWAKLFCFYRCTIKLRHDTIEEFNVDSKAEYLT